MPAAHCTNRCGASEVAGLSAARKEQAWKHLRWLMHSILAQGWQGKGVASWMLGQEPHGRV